MKTDHSLIIYITKEQLRSFLIRYQGLSFPNEFEGKEGIIKLFNRIGSIQYDPLNVIGKNADLVLRSRILNYKEDVLTQMLYNDRTLIDGWDKMMSIYLTKEYPYFHHIRKQKNEEHHHMLERRNQLDALKYIEHVISYIKENGPTYPKDIDLGSSKKGTWGHGKISSVVCDYLWNIGRLGVAYKNNVIKKYDLIENLIDPKLIEEEPLNDINEFLKWYVLRKIGSIGIYWSKPGPVWLNYFTSKGSARKQIIDVLLKENKLKLVEVEGMKEDFYIRTNDIELLYKEVDISKKLKFIAPLDNLLWDRKFVLKVFDFDYTWEVYVPEDKRKYGYYVIPVLYGDRFIARFEPDGKRSLNNFSIKNWWWEKGVNPDKQMIEDICQAFNELTDFLGVKRFNKKDIKSIIGKNKD